MAFDWYEHAGVHGLALLVTALIVVSERLYGVSYEQTRRVMSSSTLSSWTLLPAVLAFLTVTLLIVFMVSPAQKRRRYGETNALTKGTPKWPKKNEHPTDEGFALSLKGWPGVQPPIMGSIMEDTGDLDLYHIGGALRVFI
jgi:hypothetical protein